MIPILKMLLSFIQSIRSDLASQQQRRREILDLITGTCLETQIYATDIRKGKKRDTETERELARQWNQLSNAVITYDKKLSKKCHFKSQYWVDPDSWEDKKVEQLGLEIDRVMYEARELRVMADEEFQLNEI